MYVSIVFCKVSMFPCVVYMCMFLSIGVISGVWYLNNVFVSYMCELVGGSVTDTVLISWLKSLLLLMCVEVGACCV